MTDEQFLLTELARHEQDAFAALLRAVERLFALIELRSRRNTTLTSGAYPSPLAGALPQAGLPVF